MEYRKRNKVLGDIFVSILISFLINFGITHSQSSTNYTLKKSVFDQAGSISQSTGYRVNDAIGQPSPVGTNTSTNYKESSGFFGGKVISTDVEKEDAIKISESFNLIQNYPNPFNPTTTIGYNLSAESQVVLAVYNLSGREVRRLVNEIKRAGSYKVEWDGKDQFGRTAGSGIYIYRIVAKSMDKGNLSYVNVKKMIFMK